MCYWQLVAVGLRGSSVVMSADAHSQKLFGDLVVSALRAGMSQYPFSHFDSAEDYFAVEHGDEQRIRELENRMDVLASDVSSMKANINMMVTAMGLQQNVQHHDPHRQFFAQHQQQQVAQPHQQLCVQSEHQQLAQPHQELFAQRLQQQDSQILQHVELQRPPQPFVQHPQQMQGGSSSSSPGSPSGGYAFRCPVCMKPQYSPKSHCNHLRRIADPQGYCFLRSDVPFHNGILRCHGSASQFISWYTKRLRSSMGPAYTEDDIRDYEGTQEQLRLDVQNAVSYCHLEVVC